jgi:EAL domain-containing protein (putative c-di-GMP-specific phosphodiesterase class I)
VVSPREFIPLAEDAGLITSIGEWVLRTACVQARAWHEQGIGPIAVSVNVSPAQFAGTTCVTSSDARCATASRPA